MMVEMEHRQGGWKTTSGRRIRCDHGTDDLSRRLLIAECGTPATWLGAYWHGRYACDEHVEWLRNRQAWGVR